MSTHDIQPVVAQHHQPTVNWIHKLQGCASAGAQKKGWKYFQTGAVHLTLTSSDRVEGGGAGSPYHTAARGQRMLRCAARQSTLTGGVTCPR